MRVWDVLNWLKWNNLLYADINISEDQLDELPMDGVPNEIMSVARFLADETLLADERDGYVPEDDEEDDLMPGEKCKHAWKFCEKFLTGTQATDRAAASVGVMDIEDDDGGDRCHSGQGVY